MKKVLSVILSLSLAFSSTLSKAEVSEEMTRAQQEIFELVDEIGSKYKENGVTVRSVQNPNKELSLRESLKDGDAIFNIALKDSESLRLRIKSTEMNENGNGTLAVGLLSDESVDPVSVSSIHFDLGKSLEENLLKANQSIKMLFDQNQRKVSSFEDIKFAALLVGFLALMIVAWFTLMFVIFTVWYISAQAITVISAEVIRPALDKLQPKAKAISTKAQGLLAKTKKAWKKTNKKELERRIISYSALGLLAYLAANKAMEQKAELESVK